MRHKKTEHQHSCDQCGKRFAYPNLLKRHKELVHETRNQEPINCSSCDITCAKPR